MKKLFIPLLFLLVISSGTLPHTKAVIYNSTTNESVTITLSNTVDATEVISCGAFKDSVLMDVYRNQPNTRVLIIQTHGNDVYGWSDGNVTYEIK